MRMTCKLIWFLPFLFEFTDIERDLNYWRIYFKQYIKIPIVDYKITQKKDVWKTMKLIKLKKRKGCITAFLITMFIVNPLMSIFYLLDGETLKQAIPLIPDWAIPVLAIFGFINLGLAIAVWNWKKFGIYGFWATAIMILIINLSIGISPIQSLLGLLGPIIITLLVRPKWVDFE